MWPGWIPHKLCIYVGFYMSHLSWLPRKKCSRVNRLVLVLCVFITTNSCLEASITKLISGLGLVGYYQTTMTTNDYSGHQLLKIFVNSMSYYFYYNKILFKPIMYRPWTRPHWFLVRHFDSWLNHRHNYISSSEQTDMQRWVWVEWRLDTGLTERVMESVMSRSLGL